LVDLASNGANATAGITASPYAITITNSRGGTFDPANYAISYVPGTLTVTQAGLTITALNQNRVYGSSFDFTGTEFTSVGLLNGHSISSATLTSLGSVATAGVAGSPYAINIGSANGVGLENYTVTYIPGAFAVTPLRSRSPRLTNRSLRQHVHLYWNRVFCVRSEERGKRRLGKSGEYRKLSNHRSGRRALRNYHRNSWWGNI
jgi:hypothetical protein